MVSWRLSGGLKVRAPRVQGVGNFCNTGILLILLCVFNVTSIANQTLHPNRLEVCSLCQEMPSPKTPDAPRLCAYLPLLTPVLSVHILPSASQPRKQTSPASRQLPVAALVSNGALFAIRKHEAACTR